MYNYCGPYWSAGRVQTSVESDVEHTNDLDGRCRDHDTAYARGEDLLSADVAFTLAAAKLGPIGAGMAAAVGAQAMARAVDKYTTNIFRPRHTTTTMTKNSSQRLRGANGIAQPKGKARAQGAPMTRDDAVRAAPVAYATKRTGSKPRMSTKGDGTITVSHRSFLTPITNNSGYTAIQVACNPGLVGSFPWLAGLASRYEMYRFTKLRYEFRSVVASSTSGVIMMSFDYDAADDAPTSKAQQAQTVPNSETNVWMNNDLSVPVDGTWRYVRQSTLASNLDIKTYDFGNMWLSSAYGDNAVGGELYVEFTVELKKPTAGFTPSGVFSCTTGAFSAPINVTANTITGVGYPFVRYSNTELLVVAGGEWLIVAEADGTGLTTAFATPTIVAVGSGSVVTSVAKTTSATLSVAVFKVRVSTGDYLSFANAGAGTTITATRVRASPVGYSNY